MQNYNPFRTPIDTDSKLGFDGDHVSDSTLYRNLVGDLQYFTFTHTDLSYVIHQVCLYMHALWELYFSDLKRIFWLVVLSLVVPPLAIVFSLGITCFLCLLSVRLHYPGRVLKLNIEV
ncbi:ribonuclease H-like domain-containing protein [Tanacetum coccineum]